MTEYRSSETVDAREVTTEGGEDIVTPAGVVHANEGDYVISHKDGDVTVADPDNFHDTWGDGAPDKEPKDADDSNTKTSDQKVPANPADDPFGDKGAKSTTPKGSK